MRLHLVGLPHAQTTRKWLSCAYSQKIVKAGAMFSAAGHDVIVYSGEGNDAVCAEHVPLLSEREQVQWFRPHDPNDLNFSGVSWDAAHPAWRLMNARAIAEIEQRAEPRDLVLLIGGNCQQQIADGVAPLTSCEWGVGYEGIFSPFCAFESYAWMHHVYGKQQIVNGRFYDTVIPNFFDPADFHLASKDDYLLFIGRITQRKGPHVAAQIATALGMRLLVAGPGASKVTRRADGGTRIVGDEVVVEGPTVEYVGPVDAAARAELMAAAACALVPTIYVEPFGGVAVEAMLSGTPVVAPDYGAFTETIAPGVSGYRFHTLADGCAAVRRALQLDPTSIRAYALERYALDAIAPLYDRWFAQLDHLHDGGWDSLPAPGI